MEKTISVFALFDDINKEIWTFSKQEEAEQKLFGFLKSYDFKNNLELEWCKKGNDITGVYNGNDVDYYIIETKLTLTEGTRCYILDL